MISAGSGQHADFVDDNEDDTRSEDSTNEHGEVSLCVAGAGADDEGILSPCQQVYEDSGNDKKVLFLMCIGLNHNDAPLFSFEMLPWSKLPKSSLVRPKNTDFGIEIDRRAKVYNILPIPRPRNWSRKSTMEWLQVNPVRDPRDIEFLTKEVLRLRDILERAQLRHQEATAAESNSGSVSGRSWRGPVPYLRVIMCLTHDHVKCLFLTRANTRTRQEIDGRNSDSRPKTVFETIADLWNSADFNPVAPASDCHVDFHTAINCSYELVAALSPATPQRIEDIFTSMRSDLLRIITRWEQSGQGEGGIDHYDGGDEEGQHEEALDEENSLAVNDDDDFTRLSSNARNIGSLGGRPARALQTRAAFLNGRPSYVLYFWEVADSHQLLQSSLQRLSNGTGASDASFCGSTAPSLSSVGSSTRRRKRRQDDSPPDSDESALRPLVQSIQDLAECQRQLVIDRSEDRRHERELQQQTQESTERGLCRERIFRRKAELSDLARKYRKLDAELDPNDERTPRLSTFYINEGRLLEEEIRQLDLQIYPQEPNNDHQQRTSDDNN